MLVLAKGNGFDGENSSFLAASVLEAQRQGDAWGGRFPMKAVHVPVLVGNTVSVRMEHSNKKSLDGEDEGDVLLCLLWHHLVIAMRSLPCNSMPHSALLSDFRLPCKCLAVVVPFWTSA